MGGQPKLPDLMKATNLASATVHQTVDTALKPVTQVVQATVSAVEGKKQTPEAPKESKAVATQSTENSGSRRAMLQAGGSSSRRVKFLG